MSAREQIQPDQDTADVTDVTDTADVDVPEADAPEAQAPEIPGSSKEEVITLIFSAVMIIGLLVCSILFM